MGVRLWTKGAAMTVAAALCLPAASGRAATQVEPIARLTLEGGYDSNVRYDGSGGDRMARLSPDLGLTLHDHTWRLGAAYGGDLLLYQSFTPTRVWNHRGMLAWSAQLERRLEARAEANATYAIDPVGLARLGIVSADGQALIGVGRARLSWRGDRVMTWSATFQERLVRFPTGEGSAGPGTPAGGSAVHTPGIEGARRLDRLGEAGGAYRVGFYRPFSGAAPGATAHELKAFWRREIERRVRLEIEAGPSLWSGAGGSSVVPEASATIYLWGRRGVFRLSAAHGLGVGSTATPVLSDALEFGAMQRLGPRGRLRLSADGGVWRGGEVPTGRGAVTGAGGQAELAWAITPNVEVGLAASHFQRIDEYTPERRRTTAGLRLGWRMPER